MTPEQEALKIAEWIATYARSPATTIQDAERLFNAASLLRHLAGRYRSHLAGFHEGRDAAADHHAVQAVFFMGGDDGQIVKFHLESEEAIRALEPKP